MDTKEIVKHGVKGVYFFNTIFCLFLWKAYWQFINIIWWESKNIMLNIILLKTKLREVSYLFIKANMLSILSSNPLEHHQGYFLNV